MTFAETPSFVTPPANPDHDDDCVPPLELNPTSDNDENNADVYAIAVEEGNLDITTSTPCSEYFDEYEFNHQRPDSIHNKSNVTEKMLKDISDKVAAAESLSSMSSTRSRQVFEQIELQAKLLNYFLGSNKSNINQCCIH